MPDSSARSPVCVVVCDEDAFGDLLARANALEGTTERTDAPPALVRILVERAQQHAVVAREQLRAERGGRRGHLEEVLRHEPHVGGRDERRPAREQLVGDAAERVDVPPRRQLGLRVVAERLLRRQIRGASDDARRVPAARAGSATQAFGGYSPATKLMIKAKITAYKKNSCFTETVILETL